MNKNDEKVPELSKLKNELPFSVPAHYFGDFYARLHSRLEAEEQVLPKQRYRIVRFLKPALGMAASFALVFMMVYWPLKSFLPKNLAGSNSPVEISTEEETYSSMIEKLDENSFVALIYESSESQKTDGNGLNDEELFSYLSSNISDYEIFLQTEN